jgi:O-antigen/teichoic acid export membrane protein
MLLIVFAVDLVSTLIGGLFTAAERFVSLRMLDTIRLSSVLLAAGLIFLLRGPSVSSAAIAFIIGSCAAFTLGMAIMATNFRFAFPKTLKIPSDLAREMLSYGLPLTLATSGALIIMYSDSFLLTALRGVEEVGLYNVAYPSAYAITLLASSITVTIFPKIAKLHHSNDIARIREFISFLYTYALMLLAPLILLFAAFTDTIIVTIFGTTYLPAAVAFRIFAIVALFIVVWDVNSGILFGTGMMRQRAKMLSAAALLNIVLGLLLIPSYGAGGAAVSTGISFLFLSALTTVRITRQYGVRLDVSVQLRVIVSSLAFLVSVWFLKRLLVIPNAILEAVVVMALGGIVYLASLVLLRVLTKKRLLSLKGTFL